jgi:uncharacterized protein YbaR (Trm112 family)
MLIVATDVLTCPRCGPEHGLIVRSDRLENRRVITGGLGCANCRQTYPIVDALVDLRFPPQAQVPPPAVVDPFPGEAEVEPDLRLAALLGVAGGPGAILVAGPQAALAGRIVERVPEIGALAVGPQVVGLPDRPGTSRILAEHGLPLRSRAMRGVALTGDWADLELEEGLRVLAGGGRIVLDPTPADASERLRRAGFSVLLDQDDVMVASAGPGR